MKKIALALLTSFTLTTTGVAFAGGTVPGAVAPAESPAAPVPAPIVAPAPAVVTPVVAPVAYQGWWVPLMAVALVAVAAGGASSTTSH